MNHEVKDLNSSDFNSTVGAYDNFQNSFGLNIKGVLKPFTTNIEVSGYPSYEVPAITGYGNANSLGLNPYGKNTIGEGLVWGEENIDLNKAIPDPATIRGLGIKTPNTFVGWGYDTFGYPAPNHNTEWSTSGYYGNATPSDEFLKIDGSATPSGNDVSFYDYLSGPLDLRWDGHRKVWTGHHGGVQAGRITHVYVSGEDYSEGEYYFAEAVTYDAELSDGVANYITVTGVSHIGPKPPPSSYKIRPLASGDFCFIVNHEEDNQPKLSIWLTELPQVEECDDQELFAGTVNIGNYYLTFEDGMLVATSGSTSGIQPIDIGGVNQIPYVDAFGEFAYGGITYNPITSIFQVGTVSTRSDVYIRNGGILRLYGDISNHISLKAPSGFGGPNFTLELPSEIGSSGNILSVDGSGHLSWKTDAHIIPFYIQGTGYLADESFVEYNGEITLASLLADATGSIVASVSRYRAGTEDAIGSISLVSEKSIRTADLTGWVNTDIQEGDILKVSWGGSISDSTRCRLHLRIE